MLVLPLALLVVRDRPEDLGLHPDGAADSTVTTTPALDRTPIAAELRVPAFWQLAIGLACCGFSMSLISSHAGPMLTDRVGAALGTWLGGALFDATGGYGVAFATAGALLLFAAALSMTVRQGRPGSGRAVSRIAPWPEPHPVGGGR